MLTLSIRQPWAWLIVNGYKPVENRSWATAYRGPLLIHASKQAAFDPADMRRFRQEMRQTGLVIPANLPAGGIVGIADLVDCVTVCDDPADADWHEPGQYAFILRNARPLPFLPAPGKLRLFQLDYTLSK